MGDSRTFSSLLLDWYYQNKRHMPWRETRDPYRIWLSEVMLQQTQVATVIPYYNRFIERFKTLDDLARAEDEEVLKLWEGLGYYRRCHHFLSAARQVSTDYQGRIPDDPRLFSNLPGVGEYTTAAVMSIAFGHALPVVDGNVIRVLTRYRCMDGDPAKTPVRKKIRDCMAGFIPDDNPGDFNQAVMELGATVCTPKQPLCETCPLNASCCAFFQKSVTVYPNISKKAKIPEYEVGLALIVRDGSFLVQKRPDNGHLAGMWEFPGGKLGKGETLEQAIQSKCLAELGLKVQVGNKITTASHVYSHFKIRLTLFYCHIGDQKPRSLKEQPLMWINPQQLDEYPFPSANHKCFKAIHKALV